MAAQPLPLEQQAEARLEQLVTPEVKDSLVKEFRNVCGQFNDLQRTPAVLPVSKEDLFYAAEEDWIYKKDGMTNAKTLHRFQTAGSHIVTALSQHQATLAPAALAAAASPVSKSKRSQPQQAGPFTPGRALRWLLRHALVPGLALAAGVRLWRAVPGNVLDLVHPEEEEPDRVPMGKVVALLDEVMEVTQGRPERYYLVERWLNSSDRSVGPARWLQQQQQAQRAQQGDEE